MCILKKQSNLKMDRFIVKVFGEKHPELMMKYHEMSISWEYSKNPASGIIHFPDLIQVHNLHPTLKSPKSKNGCSFTLCFWRKWQPTPVLWPGRFHGLRSLVGYSPWGRRVGHKWATSHSFSFWNAELRVLLWTPGQCLMKICWFRPGIRE